MGRDHHVKQHSSKKNSKKKKSSDSQKSLLQQQQQQQQSTTETLFDPSNTRIYELSKDEVMMILSYLKMTRSVIRRFKRQDTRGTNLLKVIYGYHHDDPNREIFCLYRHFEIEKGLASKFLDAVSHVCFSIALIASDLSTPHWNNLKNNRMITSLLVEHNPKVLDTYYQHVCNIRVLKSLFMSNICYSDFVELIRNIATMECLTSLTLIKPYSKSKSIKYNHPLKIDFKNLTSCVQLTRINFQDFVDATDFINFTSIFQIPNIRSIFLRNIIPDAIQMDEWYEFCQLNSFTPSLKELRIAGNGIYQRWLKQLPDMMLRKLLREVSIEKLITSSFSLPESFELFSDHSIAANKSLTYLDVTDSLMLPSSLFDNYSCSLTHLNMDCMSELDNIQLTNIANSSCLRHLNMGRQNILPIFEETESIEILIGNSCSLQSIPLSMKRATQLKSLVQLSLEYNGLSDAQSVSFLCSIPNLKKLSLAHNPLGSHASELITNCPTSLTYLNISHCNISDEVASLFSNNHSITHLFISNNDVRDRGAKSLLKENKTLRVLHLENNAKFQQEFESLLFENMNLIRLYLPHQCLVQHKPRIMNTHLSVHF
jgi:hypothetical protein